MYINAKPFLLHAITSVHAGSGSKIGIVDLPIQREKHTHYPKLEASSLKGSIRAYLEGNLTEKRQQDFELIFGSSPGGKEALTQASAIAFSDARILLFPIRSLRGVFVWITCPHVINRFNDDMGAFMQDSSFERLVVPNENTVSSDDIILNNDKIVLEEYTFSIKIDEKTKTLAKRLKSFVGDKITTDLESRIVVLSDHEFASFVKLSTEVNARIKIGEKGTAEGGALWYEENVPPEAIFYSYLYFGNVRRNAVKHLSSAKDVQVYMEEHMPEVFQIGGNYTIGKGLMRKIWIEGGNNGAS